MEAIAKITTYDDILSLLIPSEQLPFSPNILHLTDYLSNARRRGICSHIERQPIAQAVHLHPEDVPVWHHRQASGTTHHTLHICPTEPNPDTQLDVYYPPPTSTAAPVLFYSYGGGFVAGARTLSHPASEALSLGYGNVGSYFAYKGFVTIIADYRLAPAFRYPAAAIDVRDAVEWVFQNQDAIVNGSDVKALDKERVFILGASAGAAHVITALLSPDVSPVGVRLAGIATLGGAFALADEEKTTRNVDAYWGSQELARRTQPLTLVQEQRERVKEMPPWLFIEAENEPEFVKAGGKLTREALVGEYTSLLSEYLVSLRCLPHARCRARQAGRSSSHREGT